MNITEDAHNVIDRPGEQAPIASERTNEDAQLDGAEEEFVDNHHYGIPGRVVSWGTSARAKIGGARHGGQCRVNGVGGGGGE